MSPCAQDGPRTGAAERRARRERPGPDERARLANGLGMVIFREQVITGLSVPDLAMLARLDRSHMFKIIAGKARPSDCGLLRIARALRPDHDRAGAAELYVELERAAGSSLYRSPSWRPRARWRRMIDTARAEQQGAGKASAPVSASGGTDARRGGRTAAPGVLGGPLDTSEETRTRVRSMMAAVRRP